MWCGTAGLNEALAFSLSFTREGVGQQLAEGWCALLHQAELSAKVELI